MSTLLIYGLCLVGALGLHLLMRPGDDGRRTQGLRAIGAVLGLGVVAYFIIATIDATIGPDRSPGLFFSLFALVSVVSATQMITTSRPVYAALHFVLVVLASAGLFLLLEAEFMAFALIIVYAGAILITYMFVLMLAQQAPSDDLPDAQPEYDRFSREPAAGAIVAFVLLAVLTQTIFDSDGGAVTRPPATDPPAALVASWGRLTEMPRRLDEAVAEAIPGATVVDPAEGEPPLNLLLGVRAVLEGVVTDDDLAGRLAPGLSVEGVQLPETAGADTTTVVMLGIDGMASDLDVAAIMATPSIVEEEARRVLAASNLRMAEGGLRTYVVSVDAEVRALVPPTPTEGGAAAESPETVMVRLPGSARPDNIQDVGLALITRFPASLEIAGVILLMAMFGAVLLARRQIEIGEDEKRAAVGLRPLGHYDEGDDGTDDAAATAGGSA